MGCGGTAGRTRRSRNPMRSPTFRVAVASLVTESRALLTLNGHFSLCLVAALVLGPSGMVRGESPAVDRHGDPLPAGALARLGTVRLRHPHRIIALAYSPDGKML